MSTPHMNSPSLYRSHYAKLQAVHHEHGPTGCYIISDKPMTEQEWIRERATVIDGEATEVRELEDKKRD